MRSCAAAPPRSADTVTSAQAAGARLSRITHAATGIVPSVKRALAIDGLPSANKSFWMWAITIWSSASHMSLYR